ncbi:MAG: lysylphosphatidylglycerol synthase transmembrane domain-containing protein [Elusimicrobia bacterium]|nr:lysylphosphatidylglycerol synthase transmembrane domain-containing protein [Elusimicrobiota bacterium]
MKKLEWVLLLVGATMFAAILKKMDLGAVMTSLSAIGFGFAVLFFQEIVAYMLNTLGWKYGFLPETAHEIKFASLLKMRIAGDGINYLTPSATMAGEWAKAAMLAKTGRPLEERLASVVIAKITQIAAMAMVSLAGIIFALHRKINLSGLDTLLKNGGWIILAALAVIIFLEIRPKSKEENMDGQKKLSPIKQLKALNKNVTGFIRRHPLRFALSTLFFLAAYIWGAVEAYLICYFIGMPVGIGTAILIEMLSVFMDGIFFAVPGKAGTQEATKSAIFAALGYSASVGFSFAVARHLREILWAVFGFALYYAKKRPVSATTGNNPR